MTTQNASFSSILLGVAMDPREIGRRLRRARDAKGWTQLDFALEAGVSPASVQRWERGQLPRIKELMRIAELLGVAPESLVEPERAAGSQAGTLAMDQVAERLEAAIATLALEAQRLGDLADRLEARDEQQAASG